jgi:hypothetical protein
MWAPVSTVFAGKPVRLTSKSAVAAVMFPDESLVVFNVTVTVPLPLASALLTGGTSFAGRSVAVNRVDVSEGDVGESEQPAAASASAAAIP